MNPIDSRLSLEPAASLVKKMWEDPSITLERPLEARAEGAPPGSAPWAPAPGLLGPLTGSGNGNCQ